MKLAAIALALAVLSLGIGAYGVASPLPEYKSVHSHGVMLAADIL